MKVAMPGYAKLLIGLAVALILGWVSHGPLGQSEAYLARLDAQAQAVLQQADLGQVEVRMERDPPTRQAVLSGEADSFQREGMGGLPGINGRIAALRGVASLRWADDPNARKRPIPLLAETELLVLAAFLIGLGLAKLLFRPRRQGYL
jgi:hypothetical protein